LITLHRTSQSDFNADINAPLPREYKTKLTV
jgi:hypothetical protein